jgi:hypothetical protein
MIPGQTAMATKEPFVVITVIIQNSRHRIAIDAICRV